MKLTIFNGSPRHRKSNTGILLNHFLNGFLDSHENEYVLHYLKEIKAPETFRKLFTDAECVLWAFPLYNYAMPSLVKQFIEYLEPVCMKKNNPGLMFLVQFGFPEADHARDLEKYLERLCERLNSPYLGCMLKGNCEGFNVKPKFMTQKVFQQIEGIGKDFSETGTLNKELLQAFSGMETISNLRGYLSAKALSTAGNLLLWRKQLKENNVLHQSGNRPY